MAMHDVIDPGLDVDEDEPAARPATAEEPAAGRGLRFRRRRTDEVADGGTDSVAEALAELVLLREENARLKAARHQVPSLGRVLGHARALPFAGLDAEDEADETAEMLAEVVVLRESLLEVCAELERSMAAIRARLLAIGEIRAVSGGEGAAEAAKADFDAA
jgi:hypothetical protein